MSKDPRDLEREIERLKQQAERDRSRLAEIPERQGRQAKRELAVRVVEEKADYMVCVSLDESDLRPVILADPTSTAGRDVISVAKPNALRRSFLHNKIRPNRAGELVRYIYQDGKGTERKVELVSDTDKNEFQVVIEPYLEEQTIDGDIYAGSYLVIKIVPNGTGLLDDSGDDIWAQDANDDARAFAEKDAS